MYKNSIKKLQPSVYCVLHTICIYIYVHVHMYIYMYESYECVRTHYLRYLLMLIYTLYHGTHVCEASHVMYT
jgi:hypothetical protein